MIRDGGIYLPPKLEATQKYLRAIMSGKKNYLKWKNVIVIKIPQYKGLTVKDIIKFAETQVDVHSYLPDYEYDKVPNREWLCNIVNTLIPKDFKEYVDQKVLERKESIYKSQNLNTMIKPEFVEIFKNSQSISFVKGKSHFLTRVPKKTKYQSEAEYFKAKNEETKSQVKELEDKILELNDKIESMKQMQIEAEDNVDKLSQLYELGVIDEEGRFIQEDMK